MNEPIISSSLSFYLNDIKKRIDTLSKEWDIYKKYTNPYEYINTIIPIYKKCIAKYKFLSRSYFKMIEMIHTFNIFFDSKQINTFHLAEGPGGFIEAIVNVRASGADKYIGMTILDDNKHDHNIPGWKKTDHFLAKHPNVAIEVGQDKTGDILSLANFAYCNDKYASTMDFITADGGFDFSGDFNQQENHIIKLLFAQMCFAVVMQKRGGVFIIKIFDCFMHHTVDVLYLLSSFYDKVYIFKPNTSRCANSEKYLICKDFLFDDTAHIYPYLYAAFERMNETTSNIYRFVNFPISNFFMNKIEEYNSYLGEKQIENIQNTLNIIDDKNKQQKIDWLIQMNTQKCIQWCVKYNIDINTLSL